MSRAQLEAELLAWMGEPDWRDDEARFDDLARRLFAFQFAHCAPYRRFCEGRGRTPETVGSWREIPPVPTGAFKEVALRCFPEERTIRTFRTSGTSLSTRGALHLDTLAVYEASLQPSFRRHVLPDCDEALLCVLAPPPEEAPDSSLSHMFGVLVRALGAPGSGFFVRDGQLALEPLLGRLREAAAGPPLALCGTAFAFVHLLDALAARGERLALPAGARAMETGGFKGRARELSREALYREIETHLGIPPARVVNQYGMTELASQFHDSVLRFPDEPRRKLGPPWARALLLDPAGDAPAPEAEAATGMIAVVDLANTGSVCAVLTADLGRRVADGFDVLGREPGAEARGCSLAADELLGRAVTPEAIRRRAAGGAVTPEAIAARWQALRDAGAALRRRPALETLAALGRVLDGWREPDSPWRRALEERLPAATGFAPETVREGLARGLAGWTSGALLEVAEREIGPIERLDRGGHEMVSGFDATAVVLAGSIPMPSLLALVAPLALRSPVLAKAASRDPITPDLVARSLAETDAELGACVAALSFAGSDRGPTDALLRGADCVVASGSDASVGAVAARVAPPQRLVGYGHRLSLAALGAGATRGEALARAAARAALDVALWDQLGCLSPQALYVVDADAAAVDRVAEAVAQALEEIGRRLPRGAVEAEAAALAAHERGEAEMRAAAGRGVRLLAAADGSWTVVREDRPALRPAPLHRFLRVVPVADPAALHDALRPFARHLAAVGIAGFGARRTALARLLADLGAARICPLGTMQSPPLGWRREGRGLLLPLARRSALEPA